MLMNTNTLTNSNLIDKWNSKYKCKCNRFNNNKINKNIILFIAKVN